MSLWHSFIIWVTWLLGVTACTSDATPILSGKRADVSAITLSDVRLQGRFDTSGSAGPRCSWPMCGIAARVDGTGLDVDLENTGSVRYQVVVDGEPTMHFISSGSETVRVAENLSEAIHEIAVYRVSEPFFGISQFNGVTAVGGTLLSPPAAPSRRIEVVGDSNTAAYGNEGCPFSVETEDGYRSFAAIAARALASEPHVEAYSGIGMYRNNKNETSNQMPARFVRTQSGDPDTLWDFSQWVPHVLVIVLGSNDFAQGDPGAAFDDAYIDFVNDARGYYPDATIVCTGLEGRAQTPSIEALVATIDDPHVRFFELDVTEKDCDNHPTLAAHAAMADQLVAELEDIDWGASSCSVGGDIACCTSADCDDGTSCSDHLCVTATARPTYSSEHLFATPSIDGDLREYVALPAIALTAPGGATVSYRLAWDSEALYVAGEFSDQTIFAAYNERDQSLWEDDSLEMLLDIANDGGTAFGDDDFQFYVSAAGVQFDRRGPYPEGVVWNATWASATSLDGTLGDSDTDVGYTVELGLPWSVLGVTSADVGLRFGFEIKINDRTTAETSASSAAWANINGGGMDPAGFGELVLVDQSATPGGSEDGDGDNDGDPSATSVATDVSSCSEANASLWSALVVARLLSRRKRAA